MGYVAQDGFLDWWGDAIRGTSAPPSVVAVASHGFVDQFSVVMRAIADKRGTVAARRVRSKAGPILYMGPSVPNATCQDVKEVWSKYGQHVAAFAYHHGTPTQAALARELMALGESARCWITGQRPFHANVTFWPLLRRCALIADSSAARPGRFELALESLSEAGAEAGRQAGQAATKAGTTAAIWSLRRVAPWVIGGVAVSYGLKLLR